MAKLLVLFAQNSAEFAMRFGAHDIHEIDVGLSLVLGIRVAGSKDRHIC